MRRLVPGLFGLLACSNAGTPTPPSDNFDRNALLSSLESQVIQPAHQQFLVEARALETAASAWDQAAQAGDGTAARSNAQGAWRSAMRAWQAVELLQLGPVGRSGLATGGLSLRDEVYSWPTVNPCRVDQELVVSDYQRADYPNGELINVYGLAALEYLLFQDATQNACAPQLEINQGPWAALLAEPGALEKRRAAYGVVLARHVAQKAQQIVDLWVGEAGFGRQLAKAGQAGSPFRTAQAAVDEVFAAMFYLDLEAKDRKMATPAGLSTSCPTPTCPEALESPWSKAAKDNLVANLQMFERLYLGNSPEAAAAPGFDDFLIARGAPELAAQIQADTTDALARVGALPGTMDQALTQDRNQVIEAYEAVKKVTDDLKTQFVTVLNLRVPDEGAGDND
ncbi:MAG: imelysin family protein [Deltaproteobacteria bacterium]|nr:imelysin family protein [Deltaproteobacteria bacterium]